MDKLQKLTQKPKRPKPILPKPERLTDKQRRFREATIEGGDPVAAVMEVYDTDSEETAKAIAKVNMAKANIRGPIEEALEEVGATERAGAVALAEALQADTPIVVSGDRVSGGDPDHKTRIQAAKEVFKLHDSYPKSEVNTYEYKQLDIILEDELSTLSFEALTEIIRVEQVIPDTKSELSEQDQKS